MFEKKYIQEKINIFTNDFINNLPNILLSIFILIIFYIIAEYYKFNIIPKKNNFLKTNKETEQENILKNNTNDYKNDIVYYQLSWFIYYSIIIFGLIVSLVNLGFNVATIITLLGSVSLMLGLALQETIKNIISGIYLSINKLFKIGDIVSLKSLGSLNSTTGQIIEFNLYYTTIVDNSGIITIIPNSTIQNNILTNISLSKL